MADEGARRTVDVWVDRSKSLRVLVFGKTGAGNTGKMTINDGINGFPSFFINGLIYGAKTDLLEDGLREDAVKQTRRRTESVKAPLNGLRLHYRRGRTSASSPSSPPL